MKKKKWIDVLIIFLLMFISVFIRSNYMHSIDALQTSGDYLTAAWNGESMLPSLQSFDIRAFYTWLLSQVMLFFGKKSVVAIYLNVALQTLSLVLLYGCTRLVFGKVISTIIAILVSVLPWFYESIADVSPYNLCNCMIMVCVYLVMLAGYLVCKLVGHAIRAKSAEQDAEFVMAEAAPVADAENTPVDDNEDLQVIQSDPVPPPLEDVKESPMLELPLPMPKKHIKKEMSYAFEPRVDLMHYDIDDITDKDFFDIE